MRVDITMIYNLHKLGYKPTTIVKSKPLIVVPLHPQVPNGSQNWGTSLIPKNLNDNLGSSVWESFILPWNFFSQAANSNSFVFYEKNGDCFDETSSKKEFEPFAKLKFKPSLAIESPPQLNEVMLRSLDGKTYPDHRCTKWKPLLPSGKRLHNYGKTTIFYG